MNEADQLVRYLAKEFEALGIEYFVGGSYASSLHGIPRFTRDVDIVTNVKPGDVGNLVTRLAGDFYIDSDSMNDAIVTKSSFSIIHLASMMKADIFILTDDEWAQHRWSQREIVVLGSGLERQEVCVSTVPDLIIQKLLWYKMGAEVSLQQWGDVQGLLKTFRSRLDIGYLRVWAGKLKIDELLEKALVESGMAD